MLLYKYRSIENFQYFVDIILNKRLYAAPYFDLNDPMEGQYIYADGLISNDIIKAIKGAKEKLRIVSLSRNPSNILMWSHYANGHRGVVIGVEVNSNKYDIQSVNYTNSMFNIDYDNIPQRSELAKHILSKKQSAWSYEEEERIFIKGGNLYADVKIKEIILGSRMSNQNQGFIKKLVANIDASINVRKLNIQNIELSS